MTELSSIPSIDLKLELRRRFVAEGREFSKQLYAARFDMRMTQLQFGKYLDCSREAVERSEMGTHPKTAKRLYGLWKSKVDTTRKIIP